MKATFQDRFMTVDGLRIRYWDEGDGFPLLLIHGMFVAAEIWQWNVAALSKKCRVLALDIPGFGKSERPTNGDVLTFDYIDRFFNDFARQLHIQKLNVAGSSMGGYMATQLALSSPHLVERLVLVDSAGLGREMTISIRAMAVSKLGELLSLPSRFFMRTVFYSSVFDKSRITSDYVNRLSEYYAQPNSQAIQLKILRLGVDVGGQTAIFTDKQLKSINHPTLVVWGREDRALPVKHGVRANEHLSNSRLVVFDRAGHCPMIDRDSDFNSTLIGFLSDAHAY